MPVQRLQLLIAEVGRAQQQVFARPDVDVGYAGVSRELICAAMLLAADCAAFGIAVIIADGAFGTSDLGGPQASGMVLAGSVLTGAAAFLLTVRAYGRRVPLWPEFCNLLGATGAALSLTAAAAFLLGWPLPRYPLLATACLFLPTAVCLRCLTRSSLETAGIWRLPVVVVGDEVFAAQAAAELQSRVELGYDVVARVSPPMLAGRAPGWARLLRQHRARLLVLAVGAERQAAADVLTSLSREGVPHAVLSRQADTLPAAGSRAVPLGREGGLLSYRNASSKPAARALKLAFDVTASGLALIVLAPAMLAIAALVGLDGGPVFYAHQRIGARGRVFNCLKFRSMVTDGDAVLRQVLASDPAAAEEWARTHKLRRDPRVTWIGRMLRKTSLDELPQLLNVLRLEMSLVGPRPIVSLEIPKYAEDIAYYYRTRPGITGLWQVSGRSDTTYAERVRLDSSYVKNWTLRQDISILLRTIPAVVSGRGAG